MITQSVNKILSVFTLFLLLISINSCIKQIDSDEYDGKVSDFALVIHGGAGAMKKGMYTEEEEKAYKAKLTEALNLGYKILNDGGSSLDAVEKVINLMEDSPLFNAGKGAVFANNGKNELDASIMDGKTINCGAVTGVTTIKNPITLARAVMEKSVHVMMAREGAEEFGKSLGLETVDNDYFKTERSWNRLQKAIEQEKQIADSIDNKTAAAIMNDFKFGTVGCVALDKDRNLAAGTSTGGMTNKKWGRVGDSPIIGAGSYANNKTCAVSATGHGEYFIRNVITYDISARMEYKKETLKDAANFVIMKKLKEQNGEGGIIAIDRKGYIAMPFNTDGMFRGFITDKNEPVVKIYREETVE